VITSLARPNYLPPLSVTWDPYLAAAPKMLPGSQDWTLDTPPGNQDWTLFTSYVDRAGHTMWAAASDTCNSAPPHGTTTFEDLVMACAHARGLLYQR
jgi:hypothetical protein